MIGLNGVGFWYEQYCMTTRQWCAIQNCAHLSTRGREECKVWVLILIMHQCQQLRQKGAKSILSIKFIELNITIDIHVVKFKIIFQHIYHHTPLYIFILLPYSIQNTYSIRIDKMILSNPQQGVKEMTVACCNHESTLEFSEFGEKKWCILAYFWCGYPPWQANNKENKIFFAEIGWLHRW